MVAGGQAVTQINCFQHPTQASGGLQTYRERAIPFKNFVDLNYVMGVYRRVLNYLIILRPLRLRTYFQDVLRRWRKSSVLLPRLR